VRLFTVRSIVAGCPKAPYPMSANRRSRSCASPAADIGRYAVARLIEKYGRDAKLPTCGKRSPIARRREPRTSTTDARSSLRSCHEQLDRPRIARSLVETGRCYEQYKVVIILNKIMRNSVMHNSSYAGYFEHLTQFSRARWNIILIFYLN
jgi:hypothetical protein